MAAFRKARAIINRQIQEERLHYPYRVAQLYGDFYETFRGKLGTSQVEEIANAAGYITRRIDNLPADRRNQRDVSLCYSKMQNISQMASSDAEVEKAE